MTRPLILCVVGARPNFMKIAPVIRALQRPDSGVETCLLHTGQHYDADMKTSFFDQLQIPEPEVDLGVGSGSHAQQTAEIMLRFEPVLERLAPAAVLVVGDVNSTIACSLVAAKRGLPVFHVEAGLRSGDRAMPEEINRILTDQLSDLLFTTERGAAENLHREGIAPEKIVFAGNVMIDTLRFNLDRATPAAQILRAAGWADSPRPAYGLLTLHRPSNVDDPATLKRLIRVLGELSEDLPLVFPVHPRTRKQIDAAGLQDALRASRITTLGPQAYLEMLGLMRDATVVLTDSGGIQEETTALGVPCITLRDSTERPITVSEGTNTIVGTDPDKIRAAFSAAVGRDGGAGRVPEYWDGHAAERIAAAIDTWFGRARAA